MSDFQNFDPETWQEDGVLVIVSHPPPESRTFARRRSSWPATVGCATFAAVALLFTTPDAGVRGSAFLGQQSYLVRAGPGADAVPLGHWRSLGALVRELPPLEENPLDDSEPLL